MAGTGVPVRRSMLHSSLGLLVGKGGQVLAGFAFWIVAARVASTDVVGLTAAATSAVMLCTQVAALGAGSAVIIAIGKGEDVRSTLDTAFSLVVASSLPLAAAYLVFATTSGQGTVPTIFVPVFVAAVVAGTIVIVLDQTGVALGRGATSASRYASGGLVTVAAVGLAAWLGGADGEVVLLGCWAVGSVVACVIGAVQIRRLTGYRFRPTLRLRDHRGMLGTGVPNQILTLTERVPGLLLPVLVAHLVSPRTAAFWYPAWMMVWAAYSAPVMMGIVHFAEGVRDPAALRHTTRVSVGWSLGIGAAIATLLAIAAGPLLQLLGSEYSTQSAPALRILALGLVGYAIVQGFNAVCRAQGRYVLGIGFGAVMAVLLCTIPLLVAPRGVTAMATAWLVVLTAGSVVAGLLLTKLIHGGDDG